MVNAGLHTTVQDLGRFGWGRSGVPGAGALDPVAMAEANRAVGNDASAAGLECVLRGPTLIADADVLVSLVGAGWAVGPQRVAAGVPYTVPIKAGLRCWVALSGGLAVDAVLGSRSTDTLSDLGGRLLRKDDVLPLGAVGSPGAPPRPAPALPSRMVALRWTSGPHTDRLEDRLDGARFTVDARSDRTAIRFDGHPLEHTPAEVLTFGVVPGVLQLPPSGLPILLLGNCQSTGGYPVVGVVCSVDLRVAAQLRPGARVRLERVELAQARELSAQAAV